MGILFLNSPVAQAETAAQAESSALPRTITVVGEGRVQSAPDIAQINIGIETIGPDVKQASADATTTMDQLLTTLEAQGVATTDIQTSY
ncbi:MAG: SIMPL domain-containing protein, partial [Anaerolineae bacterium]|nr:SIMPL domain-containing protein [Anaerolineae bacterium]